MHILGSLQKNRKVVSYAYNDSGIRLRKTVNGVTTQYFLNGSMIVAEVTGDVQTDYYYDESGNVFGFKRGDSEYYYIRNGQGDIIGILDSSGTQVVSYVYDSWGKLVSVTDASGNDKSGDASFIGNLNPFRYRGYYYDTETGLYYLNSRYYDPEVGRFLNIDSEMGVNGDIHAYNLFAYCGNNPVCRMDSQGRSWLSVVVAAVAVVAVCAVAIAAAPVVAPVIGVTAATITSTATSTMMVAATVAAGAAVLHSIEVASNETAQTNTNIKTKKPRNPFDVHHIVPHSKPGYDYPMEKLKEVGIDVYKNPLNLVPIPREYHAPMHNQKYENFVNGIFHGFTDHWNANTPSAIKYYDVVNALNYIREVIILKSLSGSKW